MGDALDFRQFVESLPHIVGSVFPDGRTEYANPATLQFTGLSLEEMAARGWAPVHPDDLERVAAAQERALADGTDFVVECRLRRRDGKHRWMLLQGRHETDTAGHLVRLVGTATDIDAQKRAATLLETLFTTAPIGLGFVDRKYRFVRVNATLAAIDGLPPQAHEGRPVAEVVPDLWPQLEPVYRRVIERGEPVLDFEVAGETPAQPGSPRTWLVSYYPVRLEADLIGVGIVALETTERLRAESELARAAAERQQLLVALLRAQESERHRIAADIHGDTLQVLAAVGLRLDRFKEVLRDPEDRAALAEFEEACHAAQARIRDLLFELWPPSLDRAGLAEALSELLGRFQDETGIATELRAEPDPDLPTELRGLLFRVATEALGNVRKHSGAGSVRVELVRTDDRQVVRIRDDGSGFDPADAFKPGHLGLLEMRERAQIAGGELSLTTAAGEGTTVEVSVPVDD